MLLSGGIDSATCLYLARKKGYRNRALTVKFHRMAESELKAANAIAQGAMVEEHRIVEIPQLEEIGDLDVGRRFRGLPPTYIPMRNSIFYSLGASFAEEVGANYIIGGHNREDMQVFMDTTPAFFESFQKAIWAGSRLLRKKRTAILRPLQLKSKAEVVSFGARLGVPFERTWSCYREGTEHCWKCEGCKKRTDAFTRAGVKDPISLG